MLMLLGVVLFVVPVLPGTFACSAAACGPVAMLLVVSVAQLDVARAAAVADKDCGPASAADTCNDDTMETHTYLLVSRADALLCMMCVPAASVTVVH
jgi:hypothetical protein